MVKATELPAAVRARYPFVTRRHVTAAGAGMSYVDEGQGSEAVLLLHGNPTWSFYYASLIRALVASGRRCIAPDHIGMGLSDKPEDYDYRLKTRIADLESLIVSLGLRRIHLVLHDWGGAIGMGFAAKHPGLIGRIVVLNTAAFPLPLIPLRIALCKAPVLGSFITRGLNGFARPAVRMAMSRRKLDAAEKRGLLCPYDSWAHRVAVWAFVRDIPMNPRHPSWNTLLDVEQGVGQFASHPALIVWGGRDFCFNDHFYHEWRRRLPQAETCYLSDVGHYVLLDADTEVLPRITAFLTAGGQTRP